MTITCPKCKTRLNLSGEKVKPEGARFKCAKCGAVLVFKGKGRKEVPDRGEETGVAVQPPPSGEIRAPLEGGETDDLTGGEERPPEVPPLRAAPESPSAREKPPDVPLNMGESPLTLKKTMAAHQTDKVSSPAAGEGGKGIPAKAVMAGSAVAVLILLLVAFFIFRSPETAPKKQPAPFPPAGQEATQPPAQATSQEGPPDVTPAISPPTATPAEEMSFSTPEEKAIGMVKRSDVLLRMTSVDSIVNKWTQDNAGKYKVVGWQAKKIDEQKFLVSYTALDGSVPKGFYFVADLQSGGVEDLAHNPELQKKYNIQYAR
ncbi:MAG: zinc-ribbon domain-containing protein [Nitrospiraceae bacterium]|nr:zinc-ribbon domain-containing protein [Nitrospiraceae bacterium]